MRKTRAVLGDWNMTCQRTGRVFKRSEMKQEWTGLWVHKSVWEPRHPQDIITPKDDQVGVYPATPEAPLVFNDWDTAFYAIADSTNSEIVDNDNFMVV